MMVGAALFEGAISIPTWITSTSPFLSSGLSLRSSLATLAGYNPKLRNFSSLNESVSLGRTIKIDEAKHLDIRAEAFNILNRTAFVPLSGGSALENANFGLWRSRGCIIRNRSEGGEDETRQNDTQAVVGAAWLGFGGRCGN
jgi:hypothetical protein